MALKIDSQARIEAVRLEDQGAAPAAPASGHTLVFAKADGLYIEQADGDVIGPFITGTAAAGGRTLISEQTPSGTGTVSFTSIPGSYKKLTIEFDARSTESATNVTHAIQLNGDTTGGNYRSSRMLSYGVNSVTGGGGDDGVFSEVPGATAPANSFSNGNIEIVQYAATSFSKIALTRDAYRRDASSVHLVNFAGAVEWENTAAITRIDLVLSAGNYDSGSVFRLYGEN